METNARVACARGLVWHALKLLDSADPDLTVSLAETLAAVVKRLANARRVMDEDMPAIIHFLASATQECWLSLGDHEICLLSNSACSRSSTAYWGPRLAF